MPVGRCWDLRALEQVWPRLFPIRLPLQGTLKAVHRSQPRRSHDGWLCWLPCRSAPDRVCRAAFDHSRCVMDTCGLERVERFRINLNEKNFASQKNTLTSSLPQRCRAVGCASPKPRADMKSITYIDAA